ncbi:MAG: isochorismatase family protein [Pseudonocardia sp.]|nr:isochorismatase family protein [Pseudonocardia sp.]
MVFGDDRRPLLEGLADNPLYVGSEAWPAVEAQRVLLGVARELGVPVVHTTGDPNMPGFDWTRRHAGQRAAPAQWRRDPDDFRFVDALAPREGEFVVAKAAPSAFFGTSVPALLQMLGVDSVIVCGESTSGCVRATAVDAASHRLRVTVPADCVYDRHEAAHAIALFDLAAKYADVVPSADVVAALRKLP